MLHSPSCSDILNYPFCSTLSSSPEDHGALPFLPLAIDFFSPSTNLLHSACVPVSRDRRPHVFAHHLLPATRQTLSAPCFLLVVLVAALLLFLAVLVVVIMVVVVRVVVAVMAEGATTAAVAVAVVVDVVVLVVVAVVVMVLVMVVVVGVVVIVGVGVGAAFVEAVVADEDVGGHRAETATAAEPPPPWSSP